MADQSAFLGTYTPLANDIAQATGLDPSVVLGIIDNETGAGTRVKGNNIFGISPTGPQGQYVKPYPDVESAAQDFITLMQTPRYRGVGAFADPADQAQALVRGGYNRVDPNWAAKVGNSAQRFGRALGYQGQDAQPPATASADPELDELKAQQTKPATPPPATAPAKSDADDPELAELKAQAAGKGGKETGPPIKQPPQKVVPGPAVPSAYEQQTDTGLPIPGAAAATLPPSPVGNALGRIGEAAVSGYQASPPLLAPGAENFLTQSGPIGRYIDVPLAKIGGGLLGAGAAIGAGLGQTAYETGNALGGPQLGRDLYMLNQVAPAALMGAPGATYAGPAEAVPTPLALTPEAARAASVRQQMAAPPTPRFVQEYYNEQYPGGRVPPQPRPEGAPVTLGDLKAAIKRADGDTPTPQAQPTFLNNTWIRQAGAVPGGYDMGRGGAALATAAQQALDQGSTVQLVTDGGRRTINIVGMRNGMMIDEKGQPWGSMSLASDGTGLEGLRITPTGGVVDPDNYVSTGEAPRSAGAAGTPPGSIPDPTRVERAANLRTSIDQSERDRAGPSLIDDTAYVTDVPGGTLPPRMYAERNFSPQVALDHKRRYANSPDQQYRKEFDANENARNESMVDLLKQDAGDANSLDQLRKDRREVAPDAFGAFDNEAPVNSQRFVDGIERFMDSPAAKVGSTERTINSVLSRMYDRDGNLEVLPSRLYGVKQHIDSLMEKAKRPTDAEGADANASQPILRALSTDVNNLIDSGAPNYGAYRQAYRAASQPVNQQRFLQNYQQGSKKLTNAEGKLQLNRLNQMLEDIHKGLSDTRPNYAQSLTDQQIQNVLNVRNELAAKQLADSQSRVKGSDSYQQFAADAASGSGPLGIALRAGAHIAGHALAFKAAQGVGLGAGELNALLGAYEMTVAPARKAARIRKATETANALAAARDAQLLSQEPVRNPLAGP